MGIFFKSKEDLIQIVESVNQDELSVCGRQMKNIANKFYTWDVIANRYHMLIMSLYNDYSKTTVESTLSLLSKDDLRAMNLAHLKHTRKFYDNV